MVFGTDGNGGCSFLRAYHSVRPLKSGENERTAKTAAIQFNRYFMRVSRCVRVLRMIKINLKKFFFRLLIAGSRPMFAEALRRTKDLILKPDANLAGGICPFSI